MIILLLICLNSTNAAMSYDLLLGHVINMSFSFVDKSSNIEDYFFICYSQIAKPSKDAGKFTTLTSVNESDGGGGKGNVHTQIFSKGNTPLLRKDLSL